MKDPIATVRSVPFRSEPPENSARSGWQRIRSFLLGDGLLMTASLALCCALVGSPVAASAAASVTARRAETVSSAALRPCLRALATASLHSLLFEMRIMIAL